MTTPTPDREALLACGTCRHARGKYCLRDETIGRPFTQSYERRYTDSDFCGPQARFHERRKSWLTRCLRALAGDRP